MLRHRAGLRFSTLSLSILVLTLALVPIARASDVIVQGTTDVRDAGLLDDVIAPGFKAAYPQYTLKYIAVGTGQALTNARAGQGDAVLTHAPTLEATFVRDGFSQEPQGRAIFYSDYVILGPAADPAGVLSGAAHDAAHAFELIAAAGAGGTANFVSRGDNSGTNTQEKIIWGLTTGVPKNAANEPSDGGAGLAAWYHKAGLGQADTVKLTEQCPFTGGNCYEMTDRGTFNRLVATGAITGLKVVSDRNTATARGGDQLLLNPFHAYAVSTAKFPNSNLAGATAFLDFLTSPEFQARLASYPSTANPAFFADARPRFDSTTTLPARITAGDSVTVSGKLVNLLPGSGPLSGYGLNVLGAPLAPLTPGAPLVYGRTGADGSFSVKLSPKRSGPLTLAFPRVLDFTAATYPLGSVRVQAVIRNVKATTRIRRVRVPVRVRVRVRVNGTFRTVTRTVRRLVVRSRIVHVTGVALPSTQRTKAVVTIAARRSGTPTYTTRKTVSMTQGRASFSTDITLPAGRWLVRASYSDAGVVDSAFSPQLPVSLP